MQSKQLLGKNILQSDDKWHGLYHKHGCIPGLTLDTMNSGFFK